jgi:hypothetical protein
VTIRGVQVAVAAWIFILAAIGAVQVFRGAYIDAGVFAVIVVALLLDAAGWLPRVESARRAPHPAALIATLVPVAGVLILAPRHGTLIAVAVVIVGLAAIAVAWPNPKDGGAGWTRATVRAGIAWSVAGVVACLWELGMYILGTVRPGGRTAYPALSDLVDPLLDAPAARVVFVTAWVLGGVFLLRRATTR